jgi:cytochrome c556
MKRTLGLVLLVLAGGGLSSGHDQPPVKERNAFMELKLRNAQDVLSGIAVADYELIKTSGENLVRLTKKAEFALGNGPKYQRHSADFRHAAEAVVRAAEDKNLDGAALAYLQMTLTCVKCHKHLRAVR